MAILLNERGIPEPSPAIVRRLREVHAGLKLRFVEPAQWAITLEWAPEDRRWEMIQRQEMTPDAAFDIVGYVPLDCSLEETPTYIANRLRRHRREDVRRMADAVAEGADAPVQAAVEQAIAEVLDRPDPTAVVPKRRGRPPKVKV